MNKLINNMAQLAGAAEYFDKKTGAAWKIRSALTNAIVWACNSYLYAYKAGNVERIASSMVTVSTLRMWVRDCTSNALMLDLTTAAIARTLGLDRVIDVHEEACRMARMKCMQTRSAAKFKRYYDEALAQFDEQRRVREQNVSSIYDLINEGGWAIDEVLSDYFESYLGMKIVGISVGDSDLYDDNSVERQADTLAEVVGNALESMYDVCEAELAGAITADKIGRLEGYHRAINNMLVITGVDMNKLAARRAKLEAAIDAEIKIAAPGAAEIDAQINAQLAAMAAPAPEPVVEKPKKMRRVKKEGLKAELAA